ncbi:MAG: NAD(P)/FAD-dependent oxidoreductase [Betaproteobacteria bacterium]
MREINSVAIIGAGIAGLSCASALQQAGIRVRVFEKSRGVGGRMSTRRSGGWECDHGAQYFTVSDDLFAKTVAQWCSVGAAAVWNPRLAVLGGERLATRAEKIVRYVGTPHMTSPANTIAQAIAIQISTTVCEIKRQVSGWKLNTVEWGWLDETFGYVILAIPQPQVAALIKGTEVSWERILNEVEMLPCWALMAQVESGLRAEFDAAFVNQGPLGWICYNSHKPQRGSEDTWLAHATAAWSKEHLELAAEQVLEILSSEFEDLTGLGIRSGSVHRWRYAQSLSALRTRYLLDDQIALGACGDWTNGDKVEGAWLSGYHLARAITKE